MSEPCACWRRQPLLPHDGHCCFGEATPDDELTCDHYEAGMAIYLEHEPPA